MNTCIECENIRSAPPTMEDPCPPFYCDIFKHHVEAIDESCASFNVVPVVSSFEKVIRHYGNDKQLLKTIEECEELIRAIKVYRDTRDTCTESYREWAIQHIHEERCDVANMLPQVDIIFKFSENSVIAEMERKMQRTMERIQKEKERDSE